VSLVKGIWSVVYQFMTNPKIIIKWLQDGKKGAIHAWNWTKAGFALFFANLRVSRQLVFKKFRGQPLTLREHKLLVRTSVDCIKLIPFSFFIIIPFAELALPIALRLFPNMLPSTFFAKQYDNAYLQRKLVAKQELATFFQEIVSERTNQIINQSARDSSLRDKAAALHEFQERLVSKDESELNPFLGVKETLQFAKLFKEEFKLEKMSLNTLQIICRILGLEPYSVQTHVVLQLRHHLVRIQKEDREILWEGVQSLTHEELVEACKERGMRFYGISDDEMRQEMSVWLEMSSHRDIPPALLLWARSITMTHSSIPIKDKPEEEVAEGPKLDEEKDEDLKKATERLRLLQEEEKILQEESEKKPAEVVKEEASEARGQEVSLTEEVEEHVDENIYESEIERCRDDKVALLAQFKKANSEIKLLHDVADLQQIQLGKMARGVTTLLDTLEKSTLEQEKVISVDKLKELLGIFERGLSDIEALVEAEKERVQREEDPLYLPPDRTRRPPPELVRYQNSPE